MADVKNKYYIGFSEEFAFKALKLIRNIIMEAGCISVSNFKGLLMIKQTEESIKTDMENGWINTTDFSVGCTERGEYFIRVKDPVVLSDYLDTIIERRA